MNKKRFYYLLALLVIIAVIIVPAVLNSNRAGSGPAAGTPAPGAPGVQSENRQAATQGSDGVNAAVQTPAVQSGSVKGQEEAPAQGGAVSPAAGSPQSPPEQQGCAVGIAVVGIDGKLLYPPANVTVKPGNKWGITALGALDATGLPYAMKPAWPDFVDSISGQACKGVSGWMYMVNGDIPIHMADKHPVKDGDKVIWWYSKSMDQEPPAWDKLASSGN